MNVTASGAKPASTYKDIQRLTGLSLSTISKHFNGGAVREANREAIRAAADELGFQVNDFARNLRRGTSRTVGVLLPALDNAFHLAIIAGVERALRPHGVGVVVCSSDRDEREPGAAVEALRAKMVDAVVAVPSAHDVAALARADAAGTPVVTVDRSFAELETDHVQLDNRAAGAMVARHLADHRHHRIGMIGGDGETSSLTERREGFLAALSERGINPDPAWVSENDLTVEAGRRAMRTLLARGERPTAVFAGNYELAVGSLIALNESGLLIGEDMSFVGFDIDEIAQVTRPRVTTVVQPMQAIAAQAASRILERLGGATATRVSANVPADLAIGASVRLLS